MTNIKIISKKEFLKQNKKPNQKKIWNSIAKPWKTYIVKKIPIVEEFLKDKKGLVLDLGCGAGRNMIPNSNIFYYGVDFSAKQLKQAEKYAKKNKIKAKFFESSADDLSNFKNEMFDYGLFISALHCLETKEKRKKAINEFFRVLTPNAEALISIWNSEDKRFKSVNYHGDVYMSWKENNILYMRYYYLFHNQEFLDLVKDTGFKILRFYEQREKDRFSRKNWIIKIKKNNLYKK
ncbi:class I SAM-dependent methyltransferase [Candidatus Pacearchaeota archaeon]|nr:class I SAM-dependent methyltransferase [Candidatus Pacearchaeota archaeon]